MTRRKKGARIDGWLIVDKSPGPSSADVVNIARRALDARKAGHAGTLDPLATGLLAVAFGEATKCVPVLADALKTYRFATRWGAETTTDDEEGETARRSDARPSDDEIRAALPEFRGDIMQTPPAFSAVKVDGARAYDLARAGEAVELKARPLHVAKLELIARPDPDHAEFELVCGKGGYVRAVARDLGRSLGCLGHVATLRRVATGPFDLSRAIPFEKLRETEYAPRIAAHLLPVATGLADIPAVAVTAEGAGAIRNGRPVPAAGVDIPQGAEAWASLHGEPVALGFVLGGLFRPRRVLNLAKGDADVDHD